MDSWVNDVKYFLMSARHPTKDYEKEYLETYQVWKAAWSKYRNEIGIKDPINSDGFIQPDEVGALFYKGQCVGLASFTYGNLAYGTMSELSWFKSWPKEDLQKLANLSNEMIICSQLTVGPNFTGKGHIVRWKEIVSLYFLLRLVNSNHDVMAGSLNLTRGVQNACGEDAGSTVLNERHIFNYSGIDIPAQLVAFENEKIQRMIKKKGIEDLCHAMWSKVTHLSEYPITRDNIIPIKKAA